MGKQKHDLGQRKRALHNHTPNPEKPARSGAIGPTGAQHPLYYGPPADVRDKAYALRQLGQPIEAQKVLDRAADEIARSHRHA